MYRLNPFDSERIHDVATNSLYLLLVHDNKMNQDQRLKVNEVILHGDILITINVSNSVSFRFVMIKSRII